MDYFNKYDNQTIEKADVLLSEPMLPDPNFERTAILLCEHNEDGSFGFVLNKKSPLKLSEVMNLEVSYEADLFIGGPVQQDTLHFIHDGKLDLEGAQEITKGIFWGGNFEQLMAYINNGTVNEVDIIYFLGYSGWSPGQLENEMKQNSWILFKELTNEMLFLNFKKEDLWKNILSKMGGKYKLFTTYPVNPNLN